MFSVHYLIVEVNNIYNDLIGQPISTDVELDLRPLINQGVEPIQKLEKVSLTDVKHCTQIGERMQRPYQEQLISTLWEHVDLFAWQPLDMLGIDPKVICHRLALCVEAKPIAQQKRKIGGDK
ncbi:hypothetical protein CR513_59743, partial [Mucuna pruriens]